MERINYILSISAKGILPKGELTGIEKLEQMFGPIQEIGGFQWNLSEGLDEKIYRAIRYEHYPLTSQEVKQLKDIFNTEKRIIKIYRLDEIF